MTIKEYKIQGKNIVHIYLSSKEREQIQIKQLKEKQIVLFISGDEDVNQVLKNMIIISKGLDT